MNRNNIKEIEQKLKGMGYEKFAEKFWRIKWQEYVKNAYPGEEVEFVMCDNEYVYVKIREK
jgi:hypothetical protein